MKLYRRLAIPYEKRAASYQVMWITAATMLWLQFADTP